MWVRKYLYRTDDVTIVSKVENTDTIVSTKSDSMLHGLGMPIILSVAKKYKGDFIASAQNGIFTATVIMSMKNSRK